MARAAGAPSAQVLLPALLALEAVAAPLELLLLLSALPPAAAGPPVDAVEFEAEVGGGWLALVCSAWRPGPSSSGGGLDVSGSSTVSIV
jgi:hypothetical protein